MVTRYLKSVTIYFRLTVLYDRPWLICNCNNVKHIQNDHKSLALITDIYGSYFDNLKNTIFFNGYLITKVYLRKCLAGNHHNQTLLTITPQPDPVNYHTTTRHCKLSHHNQTLLTTTPQPDTVNYHTTTRLC